MKIKLIFILISAFLIIDGDSLTIDCRYETSDWLIVGEILVCFPFEININETKNEAYDGLNRLQDGKTIADIQGVNLRMQKLNALPKDIDKIFPNLVVLSAYSNNIQKIDQSDLKPFGSKLEIVNFDGNNIEFLHDDVFTYNTNLKVIFLGLNQIKYIGEKTFDNLPGLIALYLGKNVCYGGERRSRDNREETLSIIAELKEKCFTDMNKLVSKASGVCAACETEKKILQFQNNKLKNQKVETCTG